MERKHFIRLLLTLGVPIALQHLVINSLNFVDTIMIGRLGEMEIAAVGLANQIYFVVNLFIFGICSGSAVFTAQYWGCRDLERLNRTAALGLILAAVPVSLVAALAYFRPEMLLRLFTRDAALISLSARYLRVVSFSFLFTAWAQFFENTVKSTERVRYPLYVALVAFGANTVLNWILIFGLLGFPALGVAGAALATVISRGLEFFLITGAVYLRKLPGAVRLRHLRNREPGFLSRYLHVVAPVVANELVWVLGVSVYMAVYGRMGPEAVTVASLTSTIERILMAFLFGTGGAASIMLGNGLGAGRVRETMVNAGRLLKITVAGSLVLGLLVVLLAPWLTAPFRLSPGTRAMAVTTIRIMGAAMAFKGFNITMLVGVLRSGADTGYTLMLDLVNVWFVAIPLGALAGLVLRWPVPLVYLMFLSEEVVKAFMGWHRYRSGKWQNVLTMERSPL